MRIQKKKKLFDEWMRIPLLSELLQMSFVSILIDVVRIINYVYGVNEDVLKIDPQKKIVKTNKDEYQYEYLISTMPVNHLTSIISNLSSS